MTAKTPPRPKDVRLSAPVDGSSFGASPIGNAGALIEIHDTHPLKVTLPYNIKDRADKAVKDAQLQQFVNTATLYKDQTRKKVCLEVFGQNYDKMRELAGAIKQHTLDHLDYYLEKFIASAEAAGSKVHFAARATKPAR